MATIDIHKIGVIGAGQMGAGIAQVCAQAGIDVVLQDVSQEKADAGLAAVASSLAKQVERQQMDEAARGAAMARIKAAADYAGFADCDLVIEAATENEELKRKIFSGVCA